MDAAPRHTGIAVIDQMTWGTHGCLFYETQQDLLDILIPYFHAGLENHEFCLYVAAEPVDAEEARPSLSAAMPDFERYLYQGQFEIVAFTEWLFTGGRFDFRKALAAFRDKRDQALARGYAGLRFVGNPYPVAREHWESFTEFERAVDALIGDSEIIGVCTYALPRSSANDVLDVVQLHQLALARRNGVWEDVAGSALRRAHDEVRRLNAGLERRIVERTALLVATNEQLSREVGERKQAEDRIQREAGRTDALLRVARVLNADLSLDTVIQTVCEETRRVMHVPIAVLSLFDGQQGVFRFAGASGLPERAADLRPFPRADYDELRPNGELIVIIPDVQAGPDLPNRHIYRELDLRTSVTVTLLLDREPIGALSIATVGQARTFDPDELKLLQGLADEAALSIQNARLFQSVNAQRERLGVLSARLVEAQELERRRIARELHDDIDQLLTGLHLTLEMIGRRLPVPPAGLGEAQQIVAQVMDRAQDLSLDLRPAMLDDLGLVPALISHFERYTRQTGVHVHFEQSEADRRFTAAVETAMFRIVQEGLTNIARHAGVRDASVSLWFDDGTLGAQIEDDGRGFDAQTVLPAHASIGLSGMEERASLLGGQLTVESAPGAGTQISVEIPVSGRLERRQIERNDSPG